MIEPISAAAITLLVKSAPIWLPAINEAIISPARDALIGKVTEKAIDKGLEGGRKWLRRDEKEQVHHLELALKNAAERGLTHFQTTEEQQQYSEVINVLSTVNADALRREALRLLTLDTPDLTRLNGLYNQVHSQAQTRPQTEINAALYLISFFEALIAQLYDDPFFKQQMSDVIQARAALILQRCFPEAVTTLHQNRDNLVHDYTREQFERDLQIYTAHTEPIFHNLKISGIVLRDKISDPELNGIFVPVRFALEDQTIPEEKRQGSIIFLLERYSSLVLLVGQLTIGYR